MSETNQKLPKNIITREDLTKFKHFLSIGDLKKKIADMPDDGLVLIQRVHDFYYEKNGWGVVLKEGDSFHHGRVWNEDLASGKYEDKEKYPNAKPEEWKPYSAEELELLKDQYHPAWCAVKYEDDPNNLYLDLHY